MAVEIPPDKAGEPKKRTVAGYREYLVSQAFVFTLFL